MNITIRLLIALAGSFLSIEAAQFPSQATIAFTHVAAIDVIAGRVFNDMTVIVTGDRISAIGKAGSVREPNGAHVVNATGKFLIPGLWDMHVHWYEKDFLPLFLANGVTGMRIMWGMRVHHQWRRELQSGALLAPRMIIASSLIDGPDPMWRGSTVARNQEEGRAAVRIAKSEGADFIKVYSRLSREAYFAIADEAKKQGLPFSGHVPISVSAVEASDAGQRSVEHLSELIQSASSRAEELGRARLTANRPVDLTTQRRIQQGYKDSFNGEKEAALILLLKRNRTWQTPTLTQLRGQEFLDPTLRNDPRLKYLSASTKANWEATAGRARQRTAEDQERSKWRWEKYLELVGMMDRAGVPILAGTDVANPWCLPGFSLHDELALLVQAGLTPAAALRAATISPAVFWGRDADLGTIAKGKIADLVLLDDNPLKDITNTTRINAVVVNGRLLDKPAIEKILNEAEVTAAKQPTQ